MIPALWQRLNGSSLMARALRSSMLTVGGFGAAQVMRLASNLILTRLLFPEAFGLMALVSVFMMGLQQFSDVGVTPAILQSRRGDERDFLNTAWTIQAVRGAGLWLLACALAWPMAWIYDEPQLLHLLPVASLTIASIGGHTRYMRAAMIETLRQDYIRTARATGAGEVRVVFGHALRNALIPVVTIIALDFGYLFSGALITETIFAWPGMGRLIYDAIMGNDFNLALVALLLATLLTLAGNFLADVAYVWLDPRISFREVER